MVVLNVTVGAMRQQAVARSISKRQDLPKKRKRSVESHYKLLIFGPRF